MFSTFFPFFAIFSLNGGWTQTPNLEMVWQVFYHWPSLLYIGVGEHAKESDKSLQRLVLVLVPRAIVNGTVNIYVKHKEASRGQL